MPTESIYDLYITDQDRNFILAKGSIAVHTAERIIRDDPRRDSLQSPAQF